MPFRRKKPDQKAAHMNQENPEVLDAPAVQQSEAEPATLSEAPASENPEAAEEGAPGAFAQLQQQLAQAEAEKAQLQDQLMRLQADFINFRKRKEREMADTIRYANEDLLQQLLPVIDNLERTLQAADKTDNLAAIQKGIQVVDHALKKQLAKIGLEAVESVGQPFDASLHEVISTVEAGEEKKGLVIDEAEKGYRLKDKVIRFAKVIVGE
jgi:molecular chaperone GrpE